MKSFPQTPLSLRHYLYACAGALAFGWQVQVAADVVADREFEDVMVITATRQPTELKDVLPATRVITRAAIERLQPRDLGSLLGRTAGIDFRDSGGRGSVGGVFVRGATPGQTIILIDGMRVATASSGITSLQNFPIDAIERIEVVRGPVSGLYGADAIGGVIQIFTRRGQEQRVTPDIAVSYRTDDTQKYSAGVTGGNDLGNFHVRVGYENSQGIDRTSIQTGGNADRDDFNEINLTVGADINLHEDLTARIGVLRNDNYVAFDNTFGTDTGFDSEGKVENSTLKLIYTPSERIRASVDAGYFKDELVTPVFFSDVTTRRVSVSGQTDITVTDAHQLSLGIDYYDDRVSSVRAYDMDSRDNIAGFATWQGRFGAFSTVASVRHDDNEAYGGDTNGSIAVSYAVADNLDAIVSFGSAFRAPTFNDLFFPGFSNPDLDPEESETVEIALAGQHFGTRWRLGGYYTSVDELIAFDAVTFTPMNIAEATLAGVEVEFSTTIAAWNFAGNLNYLDATDDTTDEYLDDRAKFSANFEVYRSFGALDVSADLEAESGRHDRTGVSVTGFVTMGLGARYQVNRYLSVGARVDNVWDEDYTQNLATATEVFRTYGRTALFSLNAQY